MREGLVIRGLLETPRASVRSVMQGRAPHVPRAKARPLRRSSGCLLPGTDRAGWATEAEEECGWIVASALTVFCVCEVDVEMAREFMPEQGRLAGAAGPLEQDGATGLGRTAQNDGKMSL